MLAAERLNDLFEILGGIHTIHEPDALWRYVLERSCRALRSEGGSFFVVRDDERMEVAAAVGVDEELLRRVPLRVGSGFSGWSALHQQALLIDDARADGRFNPMADQITGKFTRSILCIPIVAQSKTRGVLELINRREGAFGADDQEFMRVLGQQTAIAYQNLVLSRETLQTKTLLESLLINMSGGLIAVDAQRNLTVLNPAARQLLALPPSVEMGKPAVAALMDFPILLDILHKTLASGQAVSRQETQLRIHGRTTRLGYTTILISDSHQQLLGSGIIFQKLE